MLLALLNEGTNFYTIVLRTWYYGWVVHQLCREAEIVRGASGTTISSDQSSDDGF